MRCLEEPTLEELLADPDVQPTMGAEGLEGSRFYDVMQQAMRRSAARRPDSPASERPPTVIALPRR